MLLLYLDLDAISIHSLRVEGDRRRLAAQAFLRNFNPLPPCGGRPLEHYYSPG